MSGETDKRLTRREAALEFVRRFCAAEVDGLRALLADDLRFAGPLHRYASADAYLASLKKDAPDRCDYRVLSATEGDDSVSVYYDYEKPGGALRIAQLFRFREQEICEILLVFDTRGFAPRDA